MRQEVDPRGRSAADRLEVVGELASLINTTYDVAEIFRAAILKLRRVMSFRRASVVLVSDERDEYSLHTLYDTDQGGFVEEEGTYPLSRGLTGQAIRTGRAIRVDEFGGTEGIRTEGERAVSALIVPLRVDDEVIGTLNLGAKEAGGYEQEDLELAVLLGRQIETSLHYSKLLATIREQREALAREHAEAESERTRLAALIEASDAAILMVSDGRVAHANHAMSHLVGLPQEILVGGSMEQVDRALARSLRDPEALAAQKAALETGETPLRDRVEFVFPRRLVCQRTVTTVRGSEGGVLGHLVLYRDVTREAEAEAAKDEFVSIVSHELRTPLTSVKTSLGLLLKGAAGTITEEVRGFLEIGLRNLDRLIRLVDDLLDLSRIESGRIAPSVEPTELEDVVARAVEAVRAFAQEKEVRLERESSDSDVMVMGNADRLEQVVVNLLSNAIKFSPTDGRVGIHRWEAGDFVVLEISDEGPGIPEGELETIFDKFRQLEPSSTRRHGGAGLGLSIARVIVEQLGGQIWAESGDEGGSRFFVRLRQAEGAPATEQEEPAEPVGPRSALVVHRDPDVRRLLEAEFEDQGWQATAVSRGADALDEAQTEVPDVIIVGVELSDTHGLEFLQRLRQFPATADTPSMLLGPGGDPSQAVSYGADLWVRGDPEELIEAAERLVVTPRRKIVLLIEDDPAVRMGLGRMLRRGGYACIEASTGEVGLRLAQDRTPDLIITDWQVPGLDGLHLLRAFRDDAKLAHIPAIVLTGHADPDLSETVGQLGAQLVRKPFAAKTVLREIERILYPPGRSSDE